MQLIKLIAKFGSGLMTGVPQIFRTTGKVSMFLIRTINLHAYR